MAVSIARAETPEDLDAVRGLIREFHHWAMTEVSPGTNPPTFANMDAELTALPGIFGPPAGCLLLARLDGDPAGCLAFFGRDATTMEVKRMYVRPAARGHRIGEQLVTSFWPRRGGSATDATCYPAITPCTTRTRSTAARGSATCRTRPIFPRPNPTSRSAWR